MRKSLAAVVVVLTFLGACSSEPASNNSSVTAMAQRDALIEAGLNAYVSGDMARAETLFRQVLDANPNDAFANLNLGVIKARTNRTAEAVAHYEAAVTYGKDVYIDDLYTQTGSIEASNITVAQVAAGNLQRLTN